uniref:BPTI/Kunitz inhibitor domain-containing protein n=1 Tax=Ascaris lumbricoides TaxID=6252 RepID=A0A9J2Q5I2_ASCLU
LRNISEQLCLLSIDRGACGGRQTRYAFDRQTSQCVPFEYTGCGGNLNNFQTLADCMATCGALGFHTIRTGETMTRPSDSVANPRSGHESTNLWPTLHEKECLSAFPCACVYVLITINYSKIIRELEEAIAE